MSSNRRSGESSRPILAIDTRTSNQVQPPTLSSRSVHFPDLPYQPPTLSSRSVHFPDLPYRSSPTENTPQATKKSSSRVIRTFEEIEKIVPREQWYEELECGICAHVLGAPQSLVPCGHSFCGPCAWTWIKINENHTCPHCRIPVNETIPLVPNIVVDQIIDRKLDDIPDGKEKTEMRQERLTKTSEWKVLQTSLVPPKPPPKRTRGPFESLSGIFEYNPSESTGHRRRASRHLPDLGAPLPPPRLTGSYVGLNLSEVARLDAAHNGRTQNDPHVAATRRVRDSILGGQSRTLRPSREGSNPVNPRGPAQQDRGSPIIISSPEVTIGRPSTPSRHRTESGGSAVEFSPNRPIFEDRSNITRSQAFLSRQARGRDGLSRDRPVLVVDSDGSDSEPDFQR